MAVKLSVIHHRHPAISATVRRRPPPPNREGGRRSEPKLYPENATVSVPPRPHFDFSSIFNALFGVLLSIVIGIQSQYFVEPGRNFNIIFPSASVVETGGGGIIQL